MKISERLLKECDNQKWLAERIKNLKYTDDELNLSPCPKCGHEAKISIYTKSDGYCNYICANINCTHCRINTKGRCIDGYYGDTDTINDVINDWN